MKEQRVSFKTAKLAKEKGFPQKDSPNYVKSKETGKGNYVNILSYHYDDDIVFYAPRQARLQKWLRDKYLIFVEVNVDRTSNPKFSYEANKFLGNPLDLTEKEWGWININAKHLYNTYEEALDEGLIEGLNLIKV